MRRADTIANCIMMNTHNLYSNRITFPQFHTRQQELWTEAELSGCGEKVRDAIVRAHAPLY